jgi:hypothetical protein
LARLVSEKEDSLRIRTRILDGFADLQWEIGADSIEAVAKVVGSEHELKGGKVVKR